MSQLAIQNDIRFAIYDRFKEEGIEIPFPQRDLHIRTGDVVASPAAEAAKDETAPKGEVDPKALFPGAQDDKPKRRRRRRGHLGDE